ncbi:GNAT family N-acetyltransferase [Diaphorobacter sp. HDW4A]|uniref:GNAT family N-acetyltransferase n=1 Tax=Diaphorobacter sp. HDW4A TaxID=2714924 RepID=UPI00140D855F|nr:GNAT family N-acetyltransferase [Diaphorobacter sp. HDW4A]QIL81110.1 GNAT family N-acetyltransferase [Diaphorobacter sp. HDW4A]
MTTSATHSLVNVRAMTQQDHDAWLPLWKGYNAFYGREGATALPDEVTRVLWSRLFNPIEPVFAAVAEIDGRVVGLVHYLYHRSTTRIEPVCYLQDLFTEPKLRGKGVGRALIHHVYEQAQLAGASRVYWQTHTANTAGRTLYDKVASHLGFIVYSKDIEPN